MKQHLLTHKIRSSSTEPPKPDSMDATNDSNHSSHLDSSGIQHPTTETPLSSTETNTSSINQSASPPSLFTTSPMSLISPTSPVTSAATPITESSDFLHQQHIFSASTINDHHQYRQPVSMSSFFSSMTSPLVASPSGVSLPPPPHTIHESTKLPLPSYHLQQLQQQQHQFQQQGILHHDLASFGLLQREMLGLKTKEMVLPPDLGNLKRERDGELLLPMSKRPIGKLYLYIYN